MESAVVVRDAFKVFQQGAFPFVQCVDAVSERVDVESGLGVIVFSSSWSGEFGQVKTLSCGCHRDRYDSRNG
jgi:hypothetical protein